MQFIFKSVFSAPYDIGVRKEICCKRYLDTLRALREKHLKEIIVGKLCIV